MDRLSQSTPRGRPVTSVDAAKANDVLEHFISSATLKTILGNYRNICELLHLKPNVFPLFYPKLKANLNSWKAKALWKKFDARASHKCYARGKVCPNTRVLIIGAGPCGLRTAIEAQLLGAKVVVIEKRDRISRNNVLHLWPFVIEDLRALGAKKFFGKFCAGAIDHISIRQLQCILLKVALLLGVEIHTELSFEKLVEPSEKTGWRAEFKPTDHPVSQYEFDVIIGADGKRNTLQGFKRKEFRGKLAIAITANFINKRTEAEACVEEISGVAFIFNQKFFKELNAETGIDLENIVYYKDDTHYFVMTAKKPSLIDKGVIKQDYSDTARLLSPDNVDRENLMEYAREAAEFSTNYQMPDLEFAVNHYGQPDVAMFDFTSMYAAENASKVIERHGYKLLMILVGDSLLEPFWPTGSGCARGFLSSLDACWAIKAWGSGSVTPLEVLAERESIYRLLAQTTPENLSKDCKSYTVDPSTRYPNLNRAVLLPQQVLTLFDSDDPSSIEFTSRTPQPIAVIDSHRKRRRRDSHLDPNTLISWIREQIKEYDDLTVNDITTSFKDGRVLCAILHHYRPDLLDYSAIKAEDVAKNNQLVFDLLEKEIGISPVMTGEDIAKAEIPDYLAMFSYLTLIYDTFRGEIPHIKHPKLKIGNSTINPKTLIQLHKFIPQILPKNKASTIISKVQRRVRKRFNAIRAKSESDIQHLNSRVTQIRVKNLFTTSCDNNLNFTPVKSIEEHFNRNRGDFEDIEEDETGLKLRYFDENFKEIFPDNLKSNENLSSVILRYVEEGYKGILLQEFEFRFSSNTLHVNVKKPMKKRSKKRKKVGPNIVKNKLIECRKHLCQFLDVNNFKFLYNRSMSDTKVISPELTYERILNWINLSDFKECENANDTSTELIEKFSDITSVTKYEQTCKKESDEKKKKEFNDSMIELMEKLRSSNIVQFSKVTPWNKLCTVSETSLKFASINENEEIDLPEPKENVKELFKGQPKLPMYIKETPVTSSNNNHLSNSRIKRHAETVALSKPSITTDRKTKKRKSLERYETNLEERRKRLEEIATNRADRQNKRRQQRRKQTEQFIKSMQMLHMNAKPDSTEPFEDYSLFVYRQTAPHFQDRVKNLEKQFIYVPDRENRLRSQTRGAGADEEFAARIKDLEDKWRDPTPAEKKPKDLMRAIGKIETTDWNIKEIEKKIMENKLGKSTNKEKERVPKWNREQFLARQTKMEKQHLNRQNSEEAKYMELDKGIKHLEQRLKEGSVRDVGKTKVAKITEKLTPKNVESESKLVPQSNSKSSVILPTQSRSEFCHFCKKRVYLMERVSAEGRFFHRGCFKCQYCFTNLRVGSYMFDRDGQYGHRFYCMQHYGMPGEIYGDKIEAKSISKLSKENVKPLETLKTTPLSGVEGVDLLDRVQTPERIEFANLSAGHISSDHDESLSQMDEDEWTDRNFGASTAEVCSSDEDEDTSSLSGSESDNEDAYEEALEEPPTKEGTLRWMERYKQRYSKQRQGDEDSESDDYTSSSDHSSYYENSSGDEEDGPVTEGEEEIRARELRKQEVRVDPPVVQTDTGSDTEIVSESSSETSSKHNSATEISTDSEFAVDEPTPTREIPSIVFNDFNVTKTRGNYGPPKKVQVKSSVLQTPMNGKSQKKGIKLEFTPLVPSPVLPKPAPSLLNRTEGYALNRTQSTGGIATKVSLELKKKYLLGEDGIGGNIQKSGSVSTLDSKFKSFHTNITDCQKMLKPASETSSNIQVFSGKLNERSSPLSPILSQSTSHKSSDIVSPVSSSDNKVSLPKDLPLTLEQLNNSKKDVDKGFVHELEGRPRSPVQDIPIIVPQVNWSQTKNKGDDISSDSLTTSDTDSDEHTGIQKSPTVKIFENIPTVKVHTDSGEILQFAADSLVLDSLSPLSNQPIRSEIQTPSLSEPPKSISSERKVLNQPKTLPNIQNDGILPNVHNECHERALVSGQSTPSDHDSCIENTGAAMTETELSDWARDSAVSDDFEDVEFDFDSIRRNKQPKALKSLITNKIITKAYMEEFEDTGHVCGKGSDHLSSILNSIEFMDTGEETSSDEKVLVEASLKNNGYMEFHNEDDIVEDSLNPNINNIIETVNPEIRETLNLEELSSLEKNTGYCIIGDDNQILKIKELEKSKEKLNENEEDSLLIVETGTTTEENTQSDITVKNMVKDTIDTSDENKASDEQEKDEYQEHCQRLQSKVIFSNVRDSIDIRKSKRKDKSDTIAKPDLIQEEISSPQQNLQSNFSPKSLKNIYTKEEIQKVRDENQRLVQEMVMNKMKAQNRSLERKKRNRNSFSPSLSPNRLFNLSKSATADLSPNKDNISVTPDVLLVNHTPLEKSQTMSSINDYTPHRTPKHKPNLVLHSSFSLKPSASEAFSLPDIQQALKIDPNRTAEKLKENARLKAQLMSNEELGLSPEDKLKKLKERIARRMKEKEAIDVQDNIESLVLNTERRNSVLYSNDTLAKKRSNKNRPKSVSEIIKPQLTGFTSIEQNKLAFCKSDPNLLTEPYVKVEKKLKNKDRERRKSITKMISEFFGKKKEGVKSPNNSTAKGFLSRISPKSKSKEKPAVELLRTNSFSEIQCRKLDNISPPPIPPLPLHYTNSGPSHFTDESSDGEHDWKCPERSSCDTLDQSVTQEGRRISKTARKAARQAQLKRHRMAQEIQRKLEETEVKTRELEQRGVTIEKVFRGESVDINCPVEEADLLKDWFDLMRDLTELRRYERELLVRAQELELEDRHARLQQELRERLDNDEQKTKEDIKTESSIINEMMEIVAKRDSLIALLEQDRLRYSEEDRDFEEQMLTKDLRLTPLQKALLNKIVFYFLN